jgi:hypothetical protein
MLGALTPSFVFQYEKRMRVLQEDEFARTLMADNLWYTRVAKQLSIDGASERLTWFLSTAGFRAIGDGGNIPFEPLVTQSTELVPQRYASAISVKKDELLDARGGGLDILAEWSKQIGYMTAYFPQRLIAELIMNGTNTDGSANAYDGVPYFADNLVSTNFNGTSIVGHPYNPWRPQLGGYVNWLHGSATTYTQPNGQVVTYPGALPIDYTNATTTDIAFSNLTKAIAFVGSYKMPDGITPRFLRARALIGPSNLVPRMAEITDTKFIARAAGSGGGSGDIAGVIARWGLTGRPLEAQELNSTTNYVTTIEQAQQTATGQATGVKTLYQETIKGNDTTYYLVMEQNMSSMLGGLAHVVREPVNVNYFTGEAGSEGAATGIDAILNRALEVEYIAQGRFSGQYGHPYALIRIDAS